MQTPIARIAKTLISGWENRGTKPQPCNALLFEDDQWKRCDVTITERDTTAAGHPGFCSAEHSASDQENALM